jgi:selenoprotein W-related protein
VAAELRDAFPGIDVTLVPSSGGVFDVVVDGTPVFSKKQLRRHAEPGEVVQRIRAGGMGR